MHEILRDMLDWSEVWALLIPIIYFLFNTRQPRFLKPVIVYLFAALLLNLAGNIIADYKALLPLWMHSNNPLYNLHSVIRFICFSLFFMALKQNYFTRLQHILILISLFIFIIYFSIGENFGNPRHLSGNLLSAEAYLLLIFCMLYYLAKLRAEVVDISDGPDFWIVTGLSIYVVVNFFVFLFYIPMINQDSNLADSIWDVHNIAYIILCIFITKALYESTRHQYSI